MATLTPNSGLKRGESIKRTPSDLSRDLASQDLPPPSAITNGQRRKELEEKRNQLDKELAQLESDEPEGELTALSIQRFRQGELEKGKLRAPPIEASLPPPRRVRVSID